MATCITLCKQTTTVSSRSDRRRKFSKYVTVIELEEVSDKSSAQIGAQRCISCGFCVFQEQIFNYIFCPIFTALMYSNYLSACKTSLLVNQMSGLYAIVKTVHLGDRPFTALSDHLSMLVSVHCAHLECQSCITTCVLFLFENLQVSVSYSICI